ncbi:MAG: hypothetical protein RL518_2376 [Pseudomonadota bacterium]|jgi:DNA-binding Lrp family transcriptional regulator
MQSDVVKRLSDNEKLVLSACALSAVRPIEAIARQTGLSQASVRYAIQRMLDERIIEPRNYLDVFRLGLSSYVLLFSLRSQETAQRSQIVEALAKLPGVVWFSEVGGDYEYILNVCVGDVHSLMQLLDQVGERFGEVFSKKVFAQHVSYRDYSYGFSDKGQFSPEFVGTSPRFTKLNFDETDHLVLREIAERPCSYRELAERLKMPTTTAQYRVEKLRREGILKATIFLVNHSLLGFSSILMLLYAKVSNKSLRAALHEFALTSQNITTLTESVGSWDFELSAIARTPNDMRQLRDEIANRFPGQFELISSVPMYRLIRWNQYPFQSFDEYLASTSCRVLSRFEDGNDDSARKSASNL